MSELEARLVGVVHGVHFHNSIIAANYDLIYPVPAEVKG